MGQLISPATMKNWERLGITATGVRLKSRANKTSSDRIVFPIEYFHDRKNVPLVQNIVDQVRTNHIPIENVLYSIALHCFEEKKLIVNGQAQQQNVQTFIDEYRYFNSADTCIQGDIPFNEADLLGLLYQCLRTEGKRNRDGMYYTSSPVAEVLLRDLDFSREQYFLDPCCGSGNLLLHLPGTDPNHLFGIDTDYPAVMIAKCNLIMKYPGHDFNPQIFHRDFLETDFLFTRNAVNPVKGISFDYIITNPPWGAVSNLGDIDFAGIHSKESFSAFLIKSMEYLSRDGKLRFLLPESFLNIKTHSGIRSFILKNYCVEEIRTYPHSFSGVTTGFIDVTITKNRKEHITLFNTPDESVSVDASVFMKNRYTVFSVISGEDNRIIDQVNSLGKFNLSEGIFGLGIVTGDNKSKLSGTPGDGLEPIFTGKEIRPYRLLEAKYFTHYRREQFQQAARETIYRAPEKLAYKFISRRLIFAYDNTKSLFLNSANLLIPEIKGMHIKTILAFLNSELYQFVYQKQFGDIKVLKGNLTGLPFPEIDGEINKTICRLADMVICGQDSIIPDIDNIIYRIFNLDDRDKIYIKDELKK